MTKTIKNLLKAKELIEKKINLNNNLLCLLYTSPSPRD